MRRILFAEGRRRYAVAVLRGELIVATTELSGLDDADALALLPDVLPREAATSDRVVMTNDFNRIVFDGPISDLASCAGSGSIH